MSFRPRNRDKIAGATAPRNAPAFSDATMLDEISAALAALLEISKSVEKLKFCQWFLINFLRDFELMKDIPFAGNDRTCYASVIIKEK